MATDTTRIFVPQMARVYLAAVGTTAPDGPNAALDPLWREVGLFTPDSLQWATDPTFEEVRSHQSNYPTLRFQTQDAATTEVDLQEWSATNFAAVFGGGTIIAVDPTIPGVPYYKFSPPSLTGRTTVAVIIHLEFGAYHHRRIIPRAQQVEGVTQSFNKTAESTLPLRLSVLGGDVGDPWYDLTDLPAFAPVPTLTTVAPGTGVAAGGTAVTLTGTGFIPGATVKFGLTAATSVVVVSSTSITCVSPAHTAATVDVSVTTTAGTATKTGSFIYT